MKKLIVILLFNIGVIHLNGQDFYMYVGGQKHFYEISTTKILVQSDVLDTTEIKKTIHSNNPDKVKKIYTLTDRLAMIDMKNVDKSTTLELLRQCYMKNDVTYTSPVLMDETGKEIGGITNQVLVRLKSITDFPILTKSIKVYSIKSIKLCDFDERTYLVTIDKGSVKNAMQIANELYETGLFDYAEPNLIQFLKLSTNDQYFSQQWSLNNTGQFGGVAGIDIKATQAWTITTGASNIRIAILDTGVDLTHPDLQANLLSGFDATGSGGNGGVLNNLPHGTACAGVAAAQGNNVIGIAGVAYGCRILPVSIATSNSGWTTTESQFIATGINWARQNEASVISMSFTCIETSAMNTSILEAVTSGRNNNGCVLVAAAGNSNSSVIGYPARNENVIAVGAISYCGQRKSPSSCDGEQWGSNYGNQLDVVAPGVKIYTTDIQGSAGYNTSSGVNGNYYASFNGTSAACPHVAGVAALILSVRPDLTGRQVRDVIEQTTQKIGGYSYVTTSGRSNGTWNQEMGYGLVDAYDAVYAIAPRISGPSTICDQGTFTINNLPQGAIVNWSYSINLRPLSTGADYIVLQPFRFNGLGTVSATVTISASTITLPTLNLWVGKPNQPTGITFLPATPCLNQEVTALVIADNPAQSNAYYQWSGVSNIIESNWNASEIHFKTLTKLPYTTYVSVAACNDCGCSLPYTKLLSVNDCGGGNPPAPAAIYPNPATDLLTIELTEDETENSTLFLPATSTTVEPYTIQLWHERSGLVREIKSTERVTHISLLSLSKGMYFVHIQKESKTIRKQLLWVR